MTGIESVKEVETGEWTWEYRCSKRGRCGNRCNRVVFRLSSERVSFLVGHGGNGLENISILLCIP